MVEKGERWCSRFSKWPNVDVLFVYFLGLPFLLGIHKFLFLHWRYTYNSIESQIRVLGDYAFMLRDYELALSNYRLISTDYKLDKAWKRYAGVQVAPSLWCYSCFYELFLCPSLRLKVNHIKNGHYKGWDSFFFSKQQIKTLFISEEYKSSRTQTSTMSQSSIPFPRSIFFLSKL